MLTTFTIHFEDCDPRTGEHSVARLVEIGVVEGWSKPRGRTHEFGTPIESAIKYVNSAMREPGMDGFFKGEVTVAAHRHHDATGLRRATQYRFVRAENFRAVADATESKATEPHHLRAGETLCNAASRNGANAAKEPTAEHAPALPEVIIRWQVRSEGVHCSRCIDPRDHGGTRTPTSVEKHSVRDEQGRAEGVLN